MPGVRVYQLAKELKVQSALILELLDRLGREVRSDLSAIDDPTASLVRERLTAALEAEKRRLVDHPADAVEPSSRPRARWRSASDSPGTRPPDRGADEAKSKSVCGNTCLNRGHQDQNHRKSG